MNRRTFRIYFPFILFFGAIPFLLSCHSGNSPTEKKEDPFEPEDLQIGLLQEYADSLAAERHDLDSLDKRRLFNNIRFDFVAERKKTWRDEIQVKATLFNDNTEPVYFLTTTCDGECYLLSYDTSEWTMAAGISCSLVLPRIVRIEANHTYEFQATFLDNKNISSMNLGFHCVMVEKTFDVENIGLPELYTFDKNSPTVLWAKEKWIK